MEQINKTEDLRHQFDALPFNAKQEVADFIAFLTQRYRSTIDTKRPYRTIPHQSDLLRKDERTAR